MPNNQYGFKPYCFLYKTDKPTGTCCYLKACFNLSKKDSIPMSTSPFLSFTG